MHITIYNIFKTETVGIIIYNEMSAMLTQHPQIFFILKSNSSCLWEIKQKL